METQGETLITEGTQTPKEKEDAMGLLFSAVKWGTVVAAGYVAGAKRAEIKKGFENAVKAAKEAAQEFGEFMDDVEVALKQVRDKRERELAGKSEQEAPPKPNPDN